MIVSEQLSTYERENVFSRRVANNEVGNTLADALSLLERAAHVSVTVAHGYGSHSFCSIGKADAERWLATAGLEPTDPLYCRLVHFESGGFLFLGSFLCQARPSETSVDPSWGDR